MYISPLMLLVLEPEGAAPGEADFPPSLAVLKAISIHTRPIFFKDAVMNLLDG